MMNNETWRFVKMGRPRMFNQPEDLAIEIEDYFNTTDKENWTITGLSLIFGSHAKMHEYLKRPEFAELITYARTMVEEKYEHNLSSKYTSGAVFALKNIGNWVDKTEQAQTVEVKQLPSVEIGGEPLELDIGDVLRIDGDTDD